MKIRKTPVWENSIKKYKSYPIRYYLADSLADIIQVVKEAEEKNVKVKAVGSGHSFSDVAVTNDYFIDIDNLTAVKFPDQLLLKEKFRNVPLVESEAGIIIKELNKKLDALNVALINMGGINKQTLAGVISTATHGTGKDLPSIPGFVRSLTIVAAGGKVYRIEPTDGITDPVAFTDPSIELIQDDDFFYSVLVSFGCAGIIYSCIIEVKQQFYLRETKKKTNWVELKQKLLDGSIFSEADDLSDGKFPRSCALLINPYEI
ncbi:MAG TPA: FAD-binding protein, partial [Chitinophagaceae bacterium]|nr:FAD-binding protein [Chitinophagaceae bacterium]